MTGIELVIIAVAFVFFCLGYRAGKQIGLLDAVLAASRVHVDAQRLEEMQERAAAADFRPRLHGVADVVPIGSRGPDGDAA